MWWTVFIIQKPECFFDIALLRVFEVVDNRNDSYCSFCKFLFYLQFYTISRTIHRIIYTLLFRFLRPSLWKVSFLFVFLYKRKVYYVHITQRPCNHSYQGGLQTVETRHRIKNAVVLFTRFLHFVAHPLQTTRDLYIWIINCFAKFLNYLTFFFFKTSNRC